VSNLSVLTVFLLLPLPASAIRRHREARSEQQEAGRLWNQRLARSAARSAADIRLAQRRAVLNRDVVERRGAAGHAAGQRENHVMMRQRPASGSAVASRDIIRIGHDAEVEAVNRGRGVQIGAVEIAIAEEVKSGRRDTLRGAPWPPADTGCIRPLATDISAGRVGYRGVGIRGTARDRRHRRQRSAAGAVEEHRGQNVCRLRYVCSRRVGQGNRQCGSDRYEMHRSGQTAAAESGSHIGRSRWGREGGQGEHRRESHN